MDWMGYSTASVDVLHAERFAGQTSYNYRKLIKFAVNIVVAHSNKPLRIAVQLGFLISTVSFVMGCLVVIKALVYGSPIAGWASMIISLYFLSGIIISILGIIGVYLGEIFNEEKKRPLYIVQEITFNPANQLGGSQRRSES